jgi:type IV secretion system protein TrbB
MYPLLSESKRRLYEKLYHDLGQEIHACLQDEDIHEVMLNPDGQLWIDSPTQGLLQISHLSSAQAFAIIHSLAGIHGFVLDQHHPQLEADLPFFKTMQGERFTAQVPPIVAAPCFTLRKKSNGVFSLDDYVDSGRLTTKQADVLKNLVQQRKNILVCGGPGSGKTTVTNALILEAIKLDKNQRILILEDVPELQCQASNVVAMLTTDTVKLTGLLRSAMRMRPDRILIGEIRGAEALDMLKAWNTGCPGGICTVHANGAIEAIQRVIDLAMEAGLTVPPVQLVLHTLHAVVSVIRSGNQKGFINDILTVETYQDGKFSFKALV